ncbi:glycosyltransferase family 1 protein [Thalassotalea euphylliae]|uniref:Glycosyltransferase family 1 protein n=1 Tax=Thalassotalea euphylliae TaxID=1655234 RepID=A0A3E0TKW6_9GAMM|nr:glycosyltransferase family 4 protein [Thalassotalea euphylliae]REL25209.1 glycosyltransferase family 1 protein [Thalassotalea euphylliae]
MKHILLTSFSGSFGGMEIRMLQEAQLLLNSGYKVTILINAFNGIDKFRDKLPQGVKLHVKRIPYFLENWNHWRLKKFLAYFFYKRFFKRVKPDIVHVFLCWTTYGLTHLWGASKSGIPTVLSIHNVFLDEALPEYVETHLHDCFSTCLGGYGVTNSAREAFVNIFPMTASKNLTVVPNWVDLNRFSPSLPLKKTLRKDLNIDENSLVVGCIARLSVQKNIPYLVEAFADIAHQHKNVFLLIVGEGPMYDDILKVIADYPHIKDISKVLGFRENVEDFYRVIDIHALLSLREGFGISTIEAMASGCIACVTDIPGSNDVVDNDELGLRVPLHDKHKVVEQLSILLENQHRIEKLRANGLKMVAERYEKHAVENKILSFYQRLELSTSRK